MSALFWPLGEVSTVPVLTHIEIECRLVSQVDSLIMFVSVFLPTSFYLTATLGNALTYVYPALMYSAIVKKQGRKDQSVGVLVANLSAVLGVVMGVIGTFFSRESSSFVVLRYRLLAYIVY